MDADERDVDAAGDQRLDRRVGRWLGEAVELPGLQVRDPWRELEAQQREKSKNMLGITAAIGVVAADGDLALVIEQSVKDMQGFARRRRNHFGVEWGIAIGEVGVEFAPGVVAIMGVDAAGIAAEAAGPEELAVRGGRG